MSKRSVKELVDEIEGLNITELANLTEALEEKFSVSRKSQDPFRVDDRVFVNPERVLECGFWPRIVQIPVPG